MNKKLLSLSLGLLVVGSVSAVKEESKVKKVVCKISQALRSKYVTHVAVFALGVLAERGLKVSEWVKPSEEVDAE